MIAAHFRKDKIANIIQNRIPFLTSIQEKREVLDQALQAINSLDELSKQILTDGPPTMREGLKSIDLTALAAEVKSEIQKLRKPIERFKRETLNIGVLGVTGQGKSTLLLSLSRLPLEVIPTGRASYCTGARSLIIHDDDEKKAGADVSFYSEQEFLREVLAPYYKTLRLKVNPPDSIGSFERQLLPEDLDSNIFLNGHQSNGQGLLGEMRHGHVTTGEMYRHLRSYQEHVGEYKNLIGQTKQHIQIANVRKYVAQDDLGGNPLYNHLAVKEARITHRFGDLDVERVGLLDMPGLGDMRIADEEHLIKALEEEIDIVLFVIKPDADRGVIGNVNFGLYDVAHDALEGISLQESSFIVFNHKKSAEPENDNLDNCERLKREIKEGKRGVKGRRVEVQDCLIADCHDRDEAKQKVLDPILDYLVDNMSRLDKTYMDFWNRRLAALREKIESVLSKVSHLSIADTSKKDAEEIFKQNFREIWDNITTALENLLTTIKAQSKETNNVFTAYFSEKFELCRSDTGLPATADGVKEIRDREGDYFTAFAKLLHHMRTHLMQHFRDMDKRLKFRMDDVKEQVATIYMQGGKLENLLVGIQPADFFTKMTAPEMGLLPHLHETLHAFDEYQLWFCGYFQSLMRNNGYLDSMMPDKPAAIRYYYRYISYRLDYLSPTWSSRDPYIINALRNTILAYIASLHPAGSLIWTLATFMENYQGLDIPSKRLLSQEVNALFLDERQQNLAEPKPEELLQALKDAHKETVDLLKENLKPFFAEPSKATLAAVEEFTDQALRAREAKDNWDSFYREYMVKIWRNEFSQSLKWQNYQRGWQAQVVNVLTSAHKL